MNVKASVESRTDETGTVADNWIMRVTLPVFANTVKAYVPGGVAVLALNVKTELPEVVVVEGDKVAVAPGIADIPSMARLTVPVMPPHAKVVRLKTALPAASVVTTSLSTTIQ